MQISISARHGHLSTATQEKISEKVEKLRKYFDRVSAIEVTVNLEHRETPDVEVRVSADHTQDFVASDTGELMAALDSTLHKVERQIRKQKEKKIDGHRGQGHKHIEPESNEPD